MEQLDPSSTLVMPLVDYANRPVVAYHPFDGLNGLSLQEGLLKAHIDGQEVGASAVAGELDDLLASYQAVELLPGLVFCWTAPAGYIVTIDFSYAVPASREIHGWVTLEGVRYRWWAKWRQLPRGSGQVPPDRPWLHEDEIGKGFEFYLPPELSEHPDPVVLRRLTLAIEGFIYKIRDGWPVDIPHLYHFDNLFSAATPMWGGEGPAVVTDRPSRLLQVIDRSATWADPSL